MADDKTKPGEQGIVGGGSAGCPSGPASLPAGSAHRGQAPAAGNEWKGPGAAQIAELLKSIPPHYSAGLEHGGDALVISWPAPSVGCMVIVLSLLGPMLLYMLLAIVMVTAEGYSAWWGIVLGLVVGSLGAMMVEIVKRLAQSRFCVVLEPHAIRLERRDVVRRRVWLIYRGGIRDVTAIERSGLGSRGSYRLILGAGRDCVVLRRAPWEKAQWLGSVLAAWSGAEFIRVMRRESDLSTSLEPHRLSGTVMSTPAQAQQAAIGAGVEGAAETGRAAKPVPTADQILAGAGKAPWRISVQRGHPGQILEVSFHNPHRLADYVAFAGGFLWWVGAAVAALAVTFMYEDLPLLVPFLAAAIAVAATERAYRVCQTSWSLFAWSRVTLESDWILVDNALFGQKYMRPLRRDRVQSVSVRPARRVVFHTTPGWVLILNAEASWTVVSDESRDLCVWVGKLISAWAGVPLTEDFVPYCPVGEEHVRRGWAKQSPETDWSVGYVQRLPQGPRASPRRHAAPSERARQGGAAEPPRQRAEDDEGRRG